MKGNSKMQTFPTLKFCLQVAWSEKILWDNYELWAFKVSVKYLLYPCLKQQQQQQQLGLTKEIISSLGTDLPFSSTSKGSFFSLSQAR